MTRGAHACEVLLEREPHSGAWNMAVDQALLEAGLEVEHSALRLYRWAEPTVSLGYFQTRAELDQDPRLSPLPAVRRLSGGGAILHHQEWTYSCVVPRGHAWSREPGRVYDEMHDAVITVLRELGVSCALRGHETGRGDQPFLCFGRGDPRDVLSGPHKILGSAQRRRRGTVLQHGSLLLARSPFAPEFPGVVDLHPDVCRSPDWWLGMGLGELLAEALAARLADSVCVTGLSPSVAERAQGLQDAARVRAPRGG